jgi:hypothetical protein
MISVACGLGSDQVKWSKCSSNRRKIQLFLGLEAHLCGQNVASKKRGNAQLDVHRWLKKAFWSMEMIF